MKFAEDYDIGNVYDLGSHQVTAEEIVDFATRYDPQGYHVSVEVGRQSFFGGLVASGWNTASIWMSLYVRGLLADAEVRGSPGVDELRWYSPVRPGDWLHGSVEVLKITPDVFERNVATLKKRGILRCNDETKPVMSLIIHSRFLRRPDSRSVEPRQ